MEKYKTVSLMGLLGALLYFPGLVQAHDFSSQRVDRSGQVKQNWYWQTGRSHGHDHGNGNGNGNSDTDEPDLSVTYTPSDALDNDFVTESGELIEEIIPDREIARLHAASQYQTIPLERHLLPPYYHLPAMNNVDDYVTTKDEFVNINPAPGEWVRIMEGKRHGFQSTTVGITYTQQGGGRRFIPMKAKKPMYWLKGVRFAIAWEMKFLRWKRLTLSISPQWFPMRL